MTTFRSVSLACVLLLPLGGCISVTGGGCTMGSANFKGSRTVAVAHVVNSPLDVETGNGEVEILKGGTESVAIVAAIAAQTQERLDATQVTTQRAADGRLLVRVVWPGGKALNGEGCSFRVTLPDASEIDVDTSNGPITLLDLGGKADLSTSNGAITVTNFAGLVDAESSNGPITLTDVQGADVETSNGDVSVQLSATPSGPLSVETSNGSVTMLVGPDFAGEIEADTSNGSVSYQGDGVAVLSQQRSSARYKLGAGGPVTTLTTSNGSIRVERKAAVPASGGK